MAKPLALLAIQLAANVLVVYCLFQWMAFPLCRHSALGVPICQVLLLATWSALGDGRWYWRLLASFLLTTLLGYTIALAGIINARPTGGIGFLVLFALGLVIVQGAATVLLMPLRQVRGWRLPAMPQSSDQRTRGQFRLQHLLAWTGAVAIALAAGRAMAWIDEQNGLMAILVVSLFAFGILPIVLPGFFTAFAERDRRKWLVVFALWTLAYASIWAAANVLMMYRTMQALRPGWVVPWWQFWPEVATVTGLHVSAAMCTIGNLLVIRRLGVRLVRPQPSQAPPAG